MVRKAFGDEGVQLSDRGALDTVLVSAPVRAGHQVVVYRAVLRTSPDESLVFLEAFYADSAQGTVARVAQSESGEEGLAWRTVLYVASWLDMQRRQGRD